MSITYELIVNACIAFTGFYIIARILQSRNPSNFLQIVTGLQGGLLGYLLMELSVDLPNGVFIDLRHLPLLLFAVYGLHLPLLIATIFIAGVRFMFGFTDPAIAAFLGTMLMGFVLYHARQFMASKATPWLLNITVLNILALLVSAGVIIINVGFNPLLWPVLSNFILIGFVVGFICSILIVDLIALYDLRLRHEKTSITDFLTGVGNTRYWDNEVNRIQKKAVKQPLAVLLFDIDHFKCVNDMHGHDNGDILLKEFARILNDHTQKGDVFARIGGEEFVMLMQGKSLEEVKEHGEGIRRAVESHEFLLRGGTSLHITVSIGIYFENDEHRQQNIPTMKFKADQAMYEAKNSGRNRVAVYAG